MEDIRYSFLVEWFDPQASLLRRYHLFFWPESNSIEMFDLKNHRTFLKRVAYPSVKLDNLFVGGCVSVYSRQIKIIDFADTFTRGRLQERLARTACMVLPHAQQHLGQIIINLTQLGFSLSRLLTVRLTDQQATLLLPEGESQWSSRQLSNGLGTVLELIAPNAIHTLADKSKSSGSLQDQLLIASDRKQYEQFVHTCFEHALPSTAVFNNCTIAVIQPHAVRDGLSGQIIQAITDHGFEISAAELLYLDRPTAEEFLEVYKTVIPQYSNLVENYTSGASIVLQIHGDKDIVQKFRQVAGPHDPEIGKHVRPDTIRAKFGKDRINNALHATDLPEDGVLESEFFFRILQDAKS